MGRLSSIFGLALLLVGGTAFADRTVSIMVDSGSGSPGMAGFKLGNPSPVTVTYGLQCFGPTGFQMMSSSGQTMASNTITAIGGMGMPSPTCADGTMPPYAGNWSQPYTGMMPMPPPPGGMVYVCERAAGVSYANRGQVCGLTMHACGIEEMNGFMLPSNSSGATKTYWLGSQSAFTYTTDGFMSVTNTSSAGTEPLISILNMGDPNIMTAGNNACRVNLAGPPAPSTIPFCAPASSTNTANGTLCCNYNPDFSQGGICKVTIESTTPISGHLQSPSFKGGSPF